MTSERLLTGVPNLDALLGGGLPAGTVTVIAGAPGSGKTILAQQTAFHEASAERRIVYFSTLSEPTAKTLKYLRPFSFFDPTKLDDAVEFVDLGMILRAKELQEAASLVLENVKRTKPALVVIDSFKMFDDLAGSRGELRKFGYELAVNLMAWEATVLLLGEFTGEDLATNPLFSIVDGIILVSQREESGEPQRFLQIVKMRGTDHSRRAHPFAIRNSGIELFSSPRATSLPDPAVDLPRCATGIVKLDALLGGIPRGASLLVSGVAGTGKTVLLLEFLYRGALAGEKGVFFSFEETREDLLVAARGLGWAFDALVESGAIEIVFVSHTNVQIEEQLVLMRKRLETTGAARMAIDSVSVFLRKIEDPEICRDKIFHIMTLVQAARAVALLATDIPYGSDRISRLGVEETLVDGVILLTSLTEGLERQRYIEVYKLRNTAHLKGRHSMAIERGGVTIYPRYAEADEMHRPPVSIVASARLASGVPGLDALIGGGLFLRSATLVSGSAGIGKSTIGLQFLVEGARRAERGVLVALEEGPDQILEAAATRGLPLKEAIEAGVVRIVYLSREQVRANQYLAILDDEIRAHGATRLVMDGISHILRETLLPEDLRQTVHTLVARFKALGVTTLLTLEAGSLAATDSVTDQNLSPVADNILMLRYLDTAGGARPTLTVVKTRASEHAWGVFPLDITHAGVRVGEQTAPELDPLHAG